MKIVDLNELAEKERDILKSLDHENIVEYFDDFEVVTGNSSIQREKKLCIVTEFCGVIHFSTFFNCFIFFLPIFLTLRKEIYLNK